MALDRRDLPGTPRRMLVAPARPGLANYVRIARPSYWFKNVFMLPGTAVALLLHPMAPGALALPLLLGVISICLLTSANYVINEYLDAEYDRHHPTKRERPTAQGLISGPGVVLEYLLLAGLGLLLAWQIGRLFFNVGLVLLAMGLIYNLEPVRTKDWPYLDVLSEAVNNPLRFALGWAIVIDHVLPPSSILLAYWFGGAFLMAVKRFAEYRSIGDPTVAGLYRRSFRHYSETTLLTSSFFYGLNAAFFLAIFLIKYRIEFILTFPLFSLLFAWYLHIGLKEDSVAQSPERLYREWRFLLLVGALVASVALLFVIDIPLLAALTERIAEF